MVRKNSIDQLSKREVVDFIVKLTAPDDQFFNMFVKKVVEPELLKNNQGVVRNDPERNLFLTEKLNYTQGVHFSVKRP